MEEVEVVVAHRERATLRVGDVFLKIDADQTRTDIEVEAMALAPIPTPEVLWRKPPVLALAALPGDGTGPPRRAVARVVGGVGRGGCRRPDAARRAAAAMARSEPRRVGIAPRQRMRLARRERRPSHALVTRNRQVAEAALRPWTPVFVHGDLQITHVFVDDDEITGVIDWSEAGPGDALYDLATLTLGHEERLGDVVAGYGTDVDLDVIRGWWSWRSLVAVRWLVENGFDPFLPGCEFEVLRSRM